MEINTGKITAKISENIIKITLSTYSTQKSMYKYSYVLKIKIYDLGWQCYIQEPYTSNKNLNTDIKSLLLSYWSELCKTSYHCPTEVKGMSLMLETPCTSDTGEKNLSWMNWEPPPYKSILMVLEGAMQVFKRKKVTNSYTQFLLLWTTTIERGIKESRLVW